MRNLLYAATAIVALTLAPAAANAAVILTFGQQSGSNTIFATANANGTTLTGTNVGVTITEIDNSQPLPITFPNAFLGLSATSTIAGATPPGAGPGDPVVEHFTGTFTITSLIGGLGTNYLSGSFSDGAITAVGATQIALAAPTGLFTSDVITDLDLPRSIGFTLTAVDPIVSLVAASGTTSGATLAPFSASVSGNAAANGVPEPASLALLGVGLLGVGFVARRKRSV